MQLGCMMQAMAQTIQIRGVPEKVHRELVRLAEAEGLSLNRLLLREFERMARQSRNAEILRRAASRPGKRVTTEEIVETIRRMRDA